MQRSEMLSPIYTSLSPDTELNYEITFNVYTEPPHCINILLGVVIIFSGTDLLR